VHPVRCQVVTNDQTMVSSLSDALPEEQAKVHAVPLREAGTRLPGELSSPMVVLDLRRPELGPSDVAALARTRPAAAMMALVSNPEDQAPAYEAGAMAVVVGSGHAAVVDCCCNLVRVLTHPQSRGAFMGDLHGSSKRFREVVFDVQSGLASATMALNLMHVISDSVERAILFLVQAEELVAVGAFGFSNDGASLAAATRGFRLSPPPESSLRRVVDDASPQDLEFDDSDLPEELTRLVGCPASGQVVLFPVLGAENTISVIYTDNGALEEEIQDIKLLDLATSQVGMAFENELLRQDVDIDGDDVNRAFDQAR
jgi:CheY-like chemotaxis protein